MSIDTTKIPEQIIALKRRIHEQCPNITEHFRELETILAEEIDSITHRKINVQTLYFARKS